MEKEDLEKLFLEKYGKEELDLLKEYESNKNKRIESLINKLNTSEIKKQIEDKVLNFLDWDYKYKQLMPNNNIDLRVDYNIYKNISDNSISMDGGLIGNILPDNMRGLFKDINILFSSSGVFTERDSICSGSKGCLLENNKDYHKNEDKMFFYSRLELSIEFSDKFPIGKTLIGDLQINRTLNNIPLIDLFLWEDSDNVLIEPHLENDYYKIPMPKELGDNKVE